MAGEITLQQLLQTPTITRVVSERKKPISAFQQRFKMLPGSGATERVVGDTFQWDVFSPTRTLAKIRPRISGPARTQERPIGSRRATVVRMHDSIHILQEKCFNTRVLGNPLTAPLDLMGQRYIARQMDQLSQKFTNGREFMVSRLFRGGFGIKFDGDDMTFVEKDDAAAVYNNDYGIAAGNLGFLPMGTGSNIINASWENPGTDIIGQLYAIRAASIRQTGMEILEYWMNSTTFQYLLHNIGLATVAGSANLIFTSIESDSSMSAEDKDAAKGFRVRFKAIPQFVFNVYDGVLNVDTESESTSTSIASLMIPNNKIIGHPEPSDNWIGAAEGSEIVAENIMDNGKHVTGFHTWKQRTITPPGWDLVAVDNFVPVLYQPLAIVYGTVGGF